MGHVNPKWGASDLPSEKVNWDDIQTVKICKDTTPNQMDSDS